MRSFRALLIASAVVSAGALAGCFGNDDETSDDPGTGAGGNTNTTPPGGTGTGTGTGTGAGTNTTQPPARPRDVNETFTLTIAAGPGQTAAVAEHPFTVPAAGWRKFEVTLAVRPAAAGQPPVFVGDKIDIQVLDPSGTAAGTGSFGPGPQNAPVVITVPSGGAAGQWKITGKQTTVSGPLSLDGTIVVQY